MTQGNGTTALAADLTAELESIPLIDAHTHLVGGKLAARGLHDILLYHMAVSDLYAAGCPDGARLTEYPGWPAEEEAHQRLRRALPYLKYVQNTSTSWGIRLILADLYDWHEPVDVNNWERLDRMVRERAGDPSWPRRIFARAGVQRLGTEWARREGGADGELLQYSLEWGFFTRCQWGEFDTALYELERCWGRQPESPAPIKGGRRPATERRVSTLEEVHAALAHYVEAMPGQVLSMATHVSTDLDLEPATGEQMAQALRRRDQAGPAERDVYAAYIHEAFLTLLEQRRPQVVFQFSLGAEPLPYETGSRLASRTVRQLGEMASRHPGLRFQCFLASQAANQSLCTLGRELPNVSLAGYWWHSFFPAIIRQVMAERLDMLPVNKQVGFFSDAYCAEWVYGKAALVRRCLAQVLADRVSQGQYSRRDALGIARAILFDTAQSLLGFTPSPALTR